MICLQTHLFLSPCTRRHVHLQAADCDIHPRAYYRRYGKELSTYPFSLNSRSLEILRSSRVAHPDLGYRPIDRGFGPKGSSSSEREKTVNKRSDFSVRSDVCGASPRLPEHGKNVPYRLKDKRRELICAAFIRRTIPQSFSHIRWAILGPGES